MDNLWLPISIAIAFYGTFKIINRIGLYRIIDSFIRYRGQQGRPLSYPEFLDSIGFLKAVTNEPTKDK